MNNQLSFSINVRDNASPALNSLKRQVSSLKSGINSLSSSSQSANNFIQSLNSGVSGADKRVRSFGGSIKSLIGTVAGLSIVRGIFNTIIGTLDRAIERLDTMDLFSQKIEMITGSAEEASTALEHLKTSTKGTPYALDIAAKAVQNFVTRGMETSKATESVDIWMDAVSAYGKGTNEQLESVLDAIAKMRTKGTVEMRYLNRLFAAGINPVQMYAKATGMAAEEVQTALSEKEISSEEFLSVVEKAMREGTNGVIKVQGMARELATTWAATTANMTTAIARGWTDLIDGLDKFVSFFNEDGLKGIVKNFGTTTEDILGGVGKGFGQVGQLLASAYSAIEEKNKGTFDRINKTIEENANATAENYQKAGEKFRTTFLESFSEPIGKIIAKFMELRETWSKVSVTFSKGIEQLSEPFARFASEYLGATITGVEDLAIAFGKWLNLKLPPFFDALERFLNWMTANKSLIVSSAKAIVTAMLSFRVLSGIKNIIIGFNNKLKQLNDLLAFFTLGKFQLPTLENLAMRPEPVSQKASRRMLYNENVASVIEPTVVKGNGKKRKRVPNTKELSEAYERIDLKKRTTMPKGSFESVAAMNAPNRFGFLPPKVGLGKMFEGLNQLLVKGKEKVVTPTVQYVKDSAVATAHGTGEFFKEGSMWAGEGLEKLGKKFIQFTKDIAEGFRNFAGLDKGAVLSDITDIAVTTGSKAKSGVKGGFDFGKDFFKNLFQGFRGLGEKDRESLPRADVRGGFKTFGGAIKTFGSNVADKTKSGVKGTFDFGKDFFKNLGRGFLGLGEKDRESLPGREVYKPIKEKVSNIGNLGNIDVLGSILRFFGKPDTKENGEKVSLKDVVKEISTTLKETFTTKEGIKNAATAPVKAVASGGKNFFGTMFQGFKDIGAGAEVGDIAAVGVASEQAAEKTGLLATVMSNLGSGFSTVITTVGSFIATIGGAVIAVTGAAAAIGLLVAGLGALNPGNTVSEGINQFFTQFGEWCTTFSTNAPILIQSFVSGLIADLPTLIDQGVNLLLALANGILTGIPNILSVGVTVLSSFISGILQVLPELVYHGFDAIGKFIAGVISNLPNVLKAGWNLLKSLVKGILTNLPIMIASGVKLVINFIKGIGSMIKNVATAIKDLIVNGVTWVFNHPQEIWESLKNLASELWDALLNGLYAAADMINAGWILDAIGAQRPEAAQAGTDTGDAVVESAAESIDSANLDLQGMIQSDNADAAAQDAAAQGQYIGESLTDSVDAEFAADSLDASVYGADTGTNYTDALSSSIESGGADVDSALSNVGTEGLATLSINFNSEQAAQAAGGLVSAINSAINENASTLYMTMNRIGQNCLVQLGASFSMVPDDVTQSIALSMAEVAVQVQSQVTVICDAIKQTLIQAKTDADTATLELAQSIITNFNTAQTSVSATLTNMQTDISNKYAGIKSSVETALIEIKDYHTTYAQQAMDSYKDIIDKGLAQTKALYDVFSANIKGILNDLASYHFTMGQANVTNYANGIKSQMQTAVDATNELVKAVKDAFVKGLGIHSPSDITYWYGQMTGKGFIEGLSDSQLAQFAKTYLNEIVDAFLDGKFSADDMVDFLGEDSLKVIHAIQEDPELMKKAMTVMPFGGSSSSMLEAARKYLSYRSNSWYWSIFNDRYGLGNNTAWCAVFVKAMADEAGVPWPAYWGVGSLKSWAEATGRWEGLNGHPGDVAIMKSVGHVGILEQPLGGTSAWVISGNTLPHDGSGNGVGVYRDLRHDMNGYIHIPGTESGTTSTSTANVGSADTIGYPLPHRVSVTSTFGGRASPGGIGSTNHGGVDLSEAGISGMAILSSLAGTVKQAGSNDGYGLSVTVSTGDLDILYGHMSAVMAQQGQSVQKGQQIGQVGSTGRSTGPHLHFEMRRNGQAFDPLPYLEGASVSIGAGGYSGGFGRNLIEQIQDAYNRKYGIDTTVSPGGSYSMDTTGSGLVNFNYNPPPEVAKWGPYVSKALEMLGEPQSLTKGVLYAIERESGGDPNAVYMGDVNAKFGGSKGLLQTIPEQFAKYRHPDLPNNMFDPLANIYACLNEMRGSYGSIQNVLNPRIGAHSWWGYAVGTRYVPFDMMAPIHKGEAILPAKQNPYSDSGGDYLADMFTSLFPNALQDMGFRKNAMVGSEANSGGSNDFNGNIVFNVTNNSDVDGDRFVNNLETELHRILQSSYMGTPAR